MDDFIQPKSRNELAERLLGKILQPQDTDEEILYKYLLNNSIYLNFKRWLTP